MTSISHSLRLVRNSLDVYPKHDEPLIGIRMSVSRQTASNAFRIRKDAAESHSVLHRCDVGRIKPPAPPRRRDAGQRNRKSSLSFSPTTSSARCAPKIDALSVSAVVVEFKRVPRRSLPVCAPPTRLWVKMTRSAAVVATLTRLIFASTSLRAFSPSPGGSGHSLRAHFSTPS